MRAFFTLFLIILLGSSADAQKITGIWRGYFTSSNSMYRDGHEEMYKYEIQIEQLANNSIKGVTYSYKSTVFYGKAELAGIFTPATGDLTIRELKLVDLKVAGSSEPCLMTCYLEYSKAGKLEVLQGTFMSLNAKDKGDCGNGKIYLEKVPTSDFTKEEFLKRKKDIDTFKTITPPPVVRAPSGNKPPANKAGATPTPPKPNNTAGNKPVDKPKVPVIPSVKPPMGNNGKPVTTNKPKPTDDKSHVQPKPVERVPQDVVNSERKTDTGAVVKTERQIQRKMPVPKVLTERENNLIKTVIVEDENIQIDLYDNGTIDNDTITVYTDNELSISKEKLSYQPITVKLKFSKTENRHELIVVAENLGDIPPNTAVMVITGPGGKHRQEVFVASTETRNAKVIFEYRPKE